MNTVIDFDRMTRAIKEAQSEEQPRESLGDYTPNPADISAPQTTAVVPSPVPAVTTTPAQNLMTAIKPFAPFIAGSVLMYLFLKFVRR